MKTVKLKKEFIVSGEEKNKMLTMPTLLEPREFTPDEKKFIDEMYKKYFINVVYGFKKPIFETIKFYINEEFIEISPMIIGHKVDTLKTEHEAKKICLDFLIDCNRNPSMNSDQAVTLFYNTLQSNIAYQLIVKSVYELK